MIVSRDQLSLQLDRLIDTFGDKAFSDQRVALIWEVVEGLEYSQVIAVVDEFLKRSRYAPLPGEFSDALKDARRSRRQFALGDLQPIEIAKCWDCADSGFIRVVRKRDYESWAKWDSGSAPCHCHRGRMAIEAARKLKSPIDLGPQFSDRWRTSYEPNPAYTEHSTTTREEQR